ncbi:MAG: translation elongation factor Ts [Gammaproteobacteria bacterium]
MAITASLVKELRARTNAPMMDCKKALEASGGDIDKAIEAMRSSGKAKAIKKADRVAAEGTVVIKQNDQAAAMLEVNCETDFVARDENFVTFSNNAAQAALDNQIETIEALKEAGSVEEDRLALVSKIGENVQCRRVAYVKAQGKLATYLHGSKIGVVVDIEGGDEALGKDVAMHIAASKPQVIAPEDVDPAKRDAEKQVFIEQAKESGKPDDIVEKMVEGRVKKFLNEISLLGQPFVKDPSVSVKQLLEQHKARVIRFERFEVGEGIEKEETDFAKEVMEQAQGS